jgi:hypothetical protein
MRRGSRKAREVAALAQLGDAQLDRAGAGFPRPVAIAVALVEPIRIARTVRRAGQALNLNLHQPLRGKSHHLAQKIGIRALLQQGPKVHHVVGHRRYLRSVDRFGDQKLPEIDDDHRCG